MSDKYRMICFFLLGSIITFLFCKFSTLEPVNMKKNGDLGEVVSLLGKDSDLLNKIEKINNIIRLNVSGKDFIAKRYFFEGKYLGVVLSIPNNKEIVALYIDDKLVFGDIVDEIGNELIKNAAKKQNVSTYFDVILEIVNNINHNQQSHNNPPKLATEEHSIPPKNDPQLPIQVKPQELSSGEVNAIPELWQFAKNLTGYDINKGDKTEPDIIMFSWHS